MGVAVSGCVWLLCIRFCGSDVLLLRLLLAQADDGIALAKVHPHPQDVHRPGGQSGQQRQHCQNHQKAGVPFGLSPAGAIIGVAGPVLRLAFLPILRIIFIVWHG